MRIAWLTDPHLNHCSLPAWERLMQKVAQSQCDLLVVTGDISEGDDVVFQLQRLADTINRPIFFVLGNHDFYQSSIESTRNDIGAITQQHPLLHYLNDEGVISLTSTVALVGEDGWGDATEGDYLRSIVLLNDFRLIDDFRNTPQATWQSALHDLGRLAANRLRSKLEEACQSHSSILIATHVPPFRESCWYEGHTTDDHWAPFFVCGQTGKVIRSLATKYPLVDFQVICGHTHHSGIANLLPNLTITTGPAVYGKPDVTGLIVVDNGIEVTLSGPSSLMA
jgi:3',5'-cyclic-AMP phosphodiesterase